MVNSLRRRRVVSQARLRRVSRGEAGLQDRRALRDLRLRVLLVCITNLFPIMLGSNSNIAGFGAPGFPPGAPGGPRKYP